MPLFILMFIFIFTTVLFVLHQYHVDLFELDYGVFWLTVLALWGDLGGSRDKMDIGQPIGICECGGGDARGCGCAWGDGGDLGFLAALNRTHCKIIHNT